MENTWYTSPHNKIFHATELPYRIDGKNVSMREYYLEMVEAQPVKVNPTEQ